MYLLTYLVTLCIKLSCVSFGLLTGSPQQTAYKANKVKSTRGPPAYDISKSQLEFLLSCGFSSAQMSRILSVSPKTLQRRLRY